MRYVIPASSGGTVARPPVEGFVIQESNTGIGKSDGEIQTYFGSRFYFRPEFRYTTDS